MQIAIGTRLLRLEPFSAAQAGKVGCARGSGAGHSWDLPLPVPGDGTAAGTAERELAPAGSSPCAPHLPHHGRTKQFPNVHKPYGKKRKKRVRTVAEPARTWLIVWKEGPRVFSRLCPGRFKGFCTIQPYSSVLLYMEKKLHWKAVFIPEGKHPGGCHLWMLFLV